MDTLDDFTVMNIIAQCDLRTAFSVVPLTCRRMYELYDDAVVVRQFRDELRARIWAMTQIYNWRSPTGRMLTAEHWRPPLELVAKARLGDFALNVKINVSNTVIQVHGNGMITTMQFGDIVAMFTGVQYVKHDISCELTTTFEAVCAQIDKMLSRVPVRIGFIMYALCGCSAPNKRYNREIIGDTPLYNLGFGYKYTTLEVTVHFYEKELGRAVKAATRAATRNSAVNLGGG